MEAWCAGETPSYPVQLAPAQLSIMIEPQDPLGVYTTLAVVCNPDGSFCDTLRNEFAATRRSEDFDSGECLEHFFQDPRPEHVRKLMSSLDEQGAFAASHFLHAFFAELIHNYPDSLASWQAHGRILSSDAQGSVQPVPRL